MTWHLITGEYPPQRGGVGDYTQSVARGLAQAGDRVEVWTPQTVAIRAEQSALERGIEVHQLPGRFGLSALWHLSRALDRFPAPRRLLVQYVPHAFGCKGGNLPFCLWLRSRRRDSTWVMFHEVKFVAGGARPAAHIALGAATHAMAALVAGGAERAFVSIPGWLPMVEPLLPRGTAATWLPVPSAIPVIQDVSASLAVRARYASGRPLVGHFGTYGEAAGALLAPALAALAGMSDCHVLLVGKGSDAACHALTDTEPRLAGRVFATGPLEAPQVSSHVAACDVMLQPYPDGISSRRTSAMAALAHGRPVVTTTGWLTEPMWAESGAVTLSPVGEPRALAAAVAALLDDDRRRQATGRRAAALYDEQFDLRHTIAALRADRTGAAVYPAAS